jgi:hypothetical protein
VEIVPLQDHARSNEHDTSHQTRGVLSQVESDGGIGGSAAGSSHGGSFGAGRLGRSGHGQSARRTGRRSGGHLTRVLGATVGDGLLAGALTLDIVRVRLDALAESGMADEERNSLLVGGHIGGGTIATDTVELQGVLFEPLITWSYRRDT